MSLKNPDHDEVNLAMEKVLPLMRALLPRGWRFTIVCSGDYDDLKFEGKSYPRTPESVQARARVIMDELAARLTEAAKELQSNHETETRLLVEKALNG